MTSNPQHTAGFCGNVEKFGDFGNLHAIYTDEMQGSDGVVVEEAEEGLFLYTSPDR